MCHVSILGLLAPLFGLHNLLAAFIPERGPAKIHIERINAVSISYQVSKKHILPKGFLIFEGFWDKKPSRNLTFCNYF